MPGNKIFGNRSFYYFAFIGALYIAVCVISINDPVHEGTQLRFPDARNYLLQSTFDITSLEFWFPTFQLSYLSPRPFTVPLLYKLAGSDPGKIIVMQKTIHFLSGFFLSLMMSFILKNEILKYLTALGICLVFCWWNILGWSQQLLSESLSFSFLFLWMASLLLMLRFRNLSVLSLHILITILFSFTRDSWPPVLLIFYTFLSSALYFFNNRSMRYFPLMLVITILIFYVQQESIQRGERHRLPVFNNLTIRILGNEDYLNYFTSHGMPQGEELKKELGGKDLHLPENRGRVYELYFNEKYKALHEWIVREGKKTYLSFLFTHPTYFFMVNEPRESINNFYSYNLYFYTGPPLGISFIAGRIFPLVPYKLLFVFVVVLTFILTKRKDVNLLLLVVLTVCLFINAILIYNADSLETDRHLFFNSVYVEILGLITGALVIDNLKSMVQARLQARTGAIRGQQK